MHKEFKKIGYNEVNKRARETYNFQKVSALLADYGFATEWLNNDYLGADFLAIHVDGQTILRVQLKAGVTICKKYLTCEGLYMAFRDQENFYYLVKHEHLVEILRENTNLLNGKKWMRDGITFTDKPSKILRKALSPYKL